MERGARTICVTQGEIYTNTNTKGKTHMNTNTKFEPNLCHTYVQWREAHGQYVSHDAKEQLQSFKVELHCPELDSKFTKEKLEMHYFHNKEGNSLSHATLQAVFPDLDLCQPK